MKRFCTLVFLLVAGVVPATHAQAAKPDPAFKKLQVLVGHWTYDGEYKAGPLGPGGKIKGEYTYQFMLNGFVLEGRSTETGTEGATHYLEIDEYDSVSKSSATSVCGDDGSRFSGVLTVAGNTITWEGKFAVAGKEYLFREPLLLSADLMSGTAKGEISADGKTWTPFFEATFTKAKPTAKK